MKVCAACSASFVSSDWKCTHCGHFPASVNGFVALAPELAEAGAGFRPEAFEQLASLESQNFWFGARNRLIIWMLEKYFPTLQRYMEIGCGTGYVLAGVAEAFPNAKLVGSEVFSVGLPYAASRVGTAELLQMDARRIPFTDEFDAIGAFDVLEHIVEDEAVLAAMLKALRPGGGVAITVPQHPWLWSTTDESACHVRRYKVGELREKAIRAGFTVVFETSFVSLLLPAMLASRLAMRRTREQTEAMPEMRLPPALNRAFEFVMNAERYLIQRGLRFGWGGSRLLIARKKESA